MRDLRKASGELEDMKLFIEIEMDNSAFELIPITELRRILKSVSDKVYEQMYRRESICDAPEAAGRRWWLR